jgi:hypothetical protein
MATRKRAAKTTKRAGARKAPAKKAVAKRTTPAKQARKAPPAKKAAGKRPVAKKTGASRGARALKVAGALVAGTAAAAAAVAYARRGTKSEEPESAADETEFPKNAGAERIIAQVRRKRGDL